MPQKGDTQINNFTGGLITEANALSFPVGASLDEVNMDVLRNGARQRRLGLDYEDGFATYDSGQTLDYMKNTKQRVFVWPTPSGSNKVEIGVIQFGTVLFFVNLFSDAPSANVLNGGLGLNAAGISNIIDETMLFDFAIINNNLLVVSAGLDSPVLLSYDDVADVVTPVTARIHIRDLYGVNDGLAPNDRPASLVPDHEYNLRNQGWHTGIVSTCGIDAVQCTKDNLGVYPSNSDTWSLGKIADVSSADIDKFDPETLKRNSFDIGNAPKGSFIIDLYDRGISRTEKSGITVTKADRELGRISTVATLAGRAFYSGIRSRVVEPDQSPKLGGAVLFSQIVKSNVDLIKCYQEADPTSPTDSELVDTDGGIIHITEAAEIIELRSIKGSMFVFATNGVWEIRGDDGGFRATSYQVNKISNVGVLGKESIVEANGTIFFWGSEGIFTLVPNQLGTGYDTINLTIDSIQTVYNTLPSLTKANVKGYYDTSKNRIRWLFHNPTPETIGIPDPLPSVPKAGTVTSFTEGARRQVAHAKVRENVGILAYINTSSTELYGRVYEVDPDTLEVTLGAETSLGTDTFFSGYDVARLEDNRILLVKTKSSGGINTRAAVLTISGNSISIGTEYTIDAAGTFRPSLTTSRIRADSITPGVAVVIGKSSTFRPAGQVLSISPSDVITFGSISVHPTITSHSSGYDNALLTTSKGIAIASSDFTRFRAMKYTISGTALTWTSTIQEFTNATQFPVATYRGGDNMSILRVSDNSAIIRCSNNNILTAQPIGQLIFTIVDQGTSFGFIEAPFQDETIAFPTSDGNTEYVFGISGSGKPVSVFPQDVNNNGDYAMEALIYPTTNNPSSLTRLTIVEEATGINADITSCGGGFVSSSIMGIGLSDNDDSGRIKLITLEVP